jgi:hypothetical protein
MAKTAPARSEPAQPPLTPEPRVLKKALARAARNAQRLADAFGVKVPVARERKR